MSSISSYSPEIGTQNVNEVQNILDNTNSSNGNNAPVNDTYSVFDRMQINDILNDTFGIDIYGVHTRTIVTDFLEYSSCNNAYSRFITLITRCNELIKTSNKNKTKDAKACVILQTICDKDEAFSSSIILPQIEQLAKSHYVALRLIGFPGETLGKAISEIAKELGGRSIMTLIVRAHGSQNIIQLGHKNFYSSSNVTAEDFSSLDSKTSIIFESCHAGRDIAKKIAAIQLRSVFAFTGSSRYALFTSCCADHGYGVVALDIVHDQIAKRFTYERDGVAEAIPCCITEIDKIKQTLFCDRVIAAESGDALAQCNLGADYSRGQNYIESAKWYLKSAEQGVTGAQHNYGIYCATGKGGVPQSHDKAAEWFLKAAEQGCAGAQYNLYVCYAEGEGVPQSFKEAVKWLLKAAEQGHVDAQYNLGVCYAKGEGVPKSFDEATKWYLKAADQGHVDSQCSLGIFYINGKWVPQSNDKIVGWLSKAVEGGYANAKDILDMVSERISLIELLSKNRNSQ